jgi:hypothetical protein
MAISFVGAAAAAAASVALPSGWQVGDLAVVFAHRDGSTTSPSLASGWTNIQAAGANTNSARSGYRVLQSGDTTTGTWTNATSIIVVVLRGHDPSSPIGAFTQTGAQSSSMAFNALTLQVGDGTSWVLLMGGHRTATDVHTTALSGTTNRSGSTNDICAHTAEDVASWATTSKTVNASSGWRTHSIEVRAEPVIIPRFRPPLLMPVAAVERSARW